MLLGSPLALGQKTFVIVTTDRIDAPRGYRRLVAGTFPGDHRALNPSPGACSNRTCGEDSANMVACEDLGCCELATQADDSSAR